MALKFQVRFSIGNLDEIYASLRSEIISDHLTFKIVLSQIILMPPS